MRPNRRAAAEADATLAPSPDWPLFSPSVMSPKDLFLLDLSAQKVLGKLLVTLCVVQLSTPLVPGAHSSSFDDLRQGSSPRRSVGLHLSTMILPSLKLVYRTLEIPARPLTPCPVSPQRELAKLCSPHMSTLLCIGDTVYETRQIIYQ